jgi:tetratricopeptide (TPR) repeat protein
MSSYPSIEETKIEYNVENCGIVTMFCPTTTPGRAFIDNENGIFIKYPQPYVEENTYDINSNDRVQYILSISDDIVEPNYTLELGIDPFQDHETQEYLNSTINDYRDYKNFKIIDAGKYNAYRLDLTKNEKYMSGMEEYMIGRDIAETRIIAFNQSMSNNSISAVENDIKIVDLTLHNYPAYKLVYVYSMNDDDDNNADFQVMEIGTKILDDFYYVQYSSSKEKFSTELPTVKRIIDSLQIDINNYNALTNKGIAHAEVGEYEEAFRYYNKVLASDQSNIYALNNKGAAYIDLSNYEEAIRNYNKVLAIDENNTYAIHDKGVALHNLGKYEEAINHYDKVLDIEDNDIDALNNKGNALADLGKHEAAFRYYDKVLAIDPNDINALYSKGFSLSSLGKYEQAIGYYDKVLAIDPNDINALYSKGFSLSSLGKYEEEITYYDKMLEINSTDINALNSKAFALANLGKNEEALPLIERALGYEPNDKYILSTMAFILYNLGKAGDAQSYYIKAMEIDPNLTELLTEKERKIFNSIMD